MAPNEILDGEQMAAGLLALIERSRPSESTDPLEVAAALALGQRAAHLLVLERLATVAGELPAILRSLVGGPEPEIDLERDWCVEPQDLLGFGDVLDLLSETALPCIAPRLHRGWQDKAESCRNARRTTRQAVGSLLLPEERKSLLAGLAIQQRLFLLPPPARPQLAEVQAALQAVRHLIQRLQAA